MILLPTATSTDIHLGRAIPQNGHAMGVGPTSAASLSSTGPNPGEGDKVLYLFDGGYLDADHRQQIALQADELRGYDFRGAEQVPDLTMPRLARRIAAGIQARTNGLTAYLEHGQSPETGA
ncbi:hypothetical protein ACIOG8_07125 [Streptomyces erythrochromogenes]|uniref:hypothetical protein n=1 Tax=Streptomyces erythrochromogenes TaxID=285574 RepID=UPI00381EF949